MTVDNGKFKLLEHVYIINRDKDVDRLERVTRRLGALGINFTRFSAIEPSSTMCGFNDARLHPSAYACAASHDRLLAQIELSGDPTALILEDDAILRDDTCLHLALMSKELEHLPWHLLFLGVHLVKAGARVSQHLGSVGAGFHSHAYVIRRDAIPSTRSWIAGVLREPRLTFDAFDIPAITKLFAIPLLAVQEPNWSHSLNRHIDRLPQYFSVFDGNDFEANCEELKNVPSQWRSALASFEILEQASSQLRVGSIQLAFETFLRAVEIWPALSNEVASRLAGANITLPTRGRSDGVLNAPLTICSTLENTIRSAVRNLL